jgi:hypothetical protein
MTIRIDLSRGVQPAMHMLQWDSRQRELRALFPGARALQHETRPGDGITTVLPLTPHQCRCM